MTGTERFLARFRSFGAEPDPEKEEALFDPAEGTVLHPGTERPLGRDQVRQYMQSHLSAIQGFRFAIALRAKTDATVFVEAENRGAVGGEPLTRGTVDCVTSKGDRVLCGRAYADRIPILARLLPETTLREIAGVGAPAAGLLDHK